MSQQLRIWQDSTEFYQLTSQVFRRLPYELKRVGSQAIAASDSVHRQIADGYCRKGKLKCQVLQSHIRCNPARG